jgi:hypothetical protein
VDGVGRHDLSCGPGSRRAAHRLPARSGVHRVPHPSRPGKRRTRVWTVDATTNAVLELAGRLVAERAGKVTLEATSVIRGSNVDELDIAQVVPWRTGL